MKKEINEKKDQQIETKPKKSSYSKKKKERRIY